ncbi:putative sulfate exporter family transporter, partial [bacterium]
MGRALFILSGIALAALALSPFKHWAAAGALIVGITLGLTVGNPFPDITKKVSKLGLQTAVVLLGFSLDLGTVARAGASGIGWALLSIGVTFAIGLGITRLWSIRPSIGLLVTSGTAICGGSAIAAMSEATDAPKEDVAVALGTVFLLNAVALVVFPALGHFFHLTPAQFGVWAGIGIHDVASVVGAATSFSPESPATATAVKLPRVLYLV